MTMSGERSNIPVRGSMRRIGAEDRLGGLEDERGDRAAALRVDARQEDAREDQELDRDQRNRMKLSRNAPPTGRV